LVALTFFSPTLRRKDKHPTTFTKPTSAKGPLSPYPPHCGLGFSLDLIIQ
jgi:hypothetical protein